MKTKEEILKILSHEIPFLRTKYGVVSCGLFGSYSGGAANPEKRYRSACRT